MFRRRKMRSNSEAERSISGGTGGSRRGPRNDRGVAEESEGVGERGQQDGRVAKR